MSEAESDLPSVRAPETEEGDGLARALVIGGFIGFVIVFGLVASGLVLLDVYGLGPAFGAGAFVGAFGGIGFGAMVGGSLHH